MEVGEEGAYRPRVEGPIAPPRRAKLKVRELIGGPGRRLGQFLCPTGLCLDSEGSIYVCDSLNHRIQKITPAGDVFGLGRRGKGWGEFERPHGIAVNGGKIFVVDSGNCRVQILSLSGSFEKAFGAPGEHVTFFDSPAGIALDSRNCLFVADTGNNRIQKFRSDGDFITEFGGRLGSFVSFNRPLGVAVGPDDSVYVADTLNHRIVVLSPAGSVQRTIGTGSLYEPADVAVDSEGFLYVAERAGRCLRVFDPDGKEFAKISHDGGEVGDFGALLGVALDPEGRVFVTDSTGHRIIGLEWS